MIKPCPFCGNKPNGNGLQNITPVVLSSRKEESKPYGIECGQPYTVFFVQCMNCGATGGRSAAGYSTLTGNTITERQAKEKALKYWNRRTNENGKETEF